jgi:hypothetical protein
VIKLTGDATIGEKNRTNGSLMPFYRLSYDKTASYSLNEQDLRKLAEKIFERGKNIGLKFSIHSSAKNYPEENALNFFRILAQKMEKDSPGSFVEHFSREIHALCMSRPNLEKDPDMNIEMLSEFFHIILQTRDK